MAVLLGYVLMGISRITHANPVQRPMDWAAAIWLWPYLAGMTLISYLGQFERRARRHPLLLGPRRGGGLEPHRLLHRHPAPPAPERVDDYARDVYPVED